MNEQEQEQMMKKVSELKAKLYDASEQLSEQSSMIKSIVDKVGYEGQDFNGLLAMIPEGVVVEEVETGGNL